MDLIKIPKKYLFLTSNHTYGHIVECITVAKKLVKLDKNCEITIVCEGNAARLAEKEGFCVIKLPLSSGCKDKYIYNAIDFNPLVEPLLDAIVRTLKPDRVIMNFRYAFKACLENKIPFVLIFPNEMKERLKFYSEIADKIFFTYPNFYINNNLSKLDIVGPILPERKNNSLNIQENTFLLSLGGGGWKDSLKKIIEKVIRYFESQEKYNLLILSNHFKLEDFNCKKKNIIFHDFVDTTEEFIDIMTRAKGIITHGGTTLIQSAYLNKPTISIPLPFLRDQIRRSEIFESKGCIVKLNEDDLNNETIKKAIESALNKNLLENQKKYLKDNNASLKIAQYLIDNSKSKNIQIDKEGYNAKYLSNNKNEICILNKPNSESKILISWTSELSIDYQNPVPEWFREIIPYTIQKELNLHRRNSEKFLSDKLIKNTSEDINGHYCRTYSFSNFYIVRWYCKESGRSFIYFSINTNKKEIKRVKCH